MNDKNCLTSAEDDANTLRISPLGFKRRTKSNSDSDCGTGFKDNFHPFVGQEKRASNFVFGYCDDTIHVVFDYRPSLVTKLEKLMKHACYNTTSNSTSTAFLHWFSSHPRS